MVSKAVFSMSKQIFRGWITHAWKKEDADTRIIQLQKQFIIILFICCLGFFIGWITSPSRLTVYLPPDITNGATMKAGSIPPPLIYSFAYEIWQELNYWPEETDNSYQKKIHTYW